MEKNRVFEILAQIGNDIILNIDFHDKKGIADGRMGSIMFLYIYAEFKDSETLFNFCNEQLLIVLDDLCEKDMSYSYGVAGIADVLQYLHDEELIEIPDRSDFFANINIEIMRQYIEPSLEPDSLYTTLYLLNDFNFTDQENSNQIENLLYLERAVQHVDEIETFLMSLEVLNFNSFTESLDRSAGIIRLTNVAKKLLNAAAFLTVLKDKKIYHKVVERCLSLLHKKNNDLWELVQNDIVSGHGYLVSSTTLHFLTVSFYLRFSFCNSIDEESKINFQKLVIDLLGTKSICSQLDLQENSISLHIGSLIRLLHINDEIDSEHIRTGINNYLNLIVENYDKQSFCSDFNQRSLNGVTLGLFGPAGLGLLLMMNQDNKFINANKILKNLYTT